MGSPVVRLVSTATVVMAVVMENAIAADLQRDAVGLRPTTASVASSAMNIANVLAVVMATHLRPIVVATVATDLVAIAAANGRPKNRKYFHAPEIRANRNAVLVDISFRVRSNNFRIASYLSTSFCLFWLHFMTVSYVVVLVHPYNWRSDCSTVLTG